LRLNESEVASTTTKASKAKAEDSNENEGDVSMHTTEDKTD